MQDLGKRTTLRGWTVIEHWNKALRNKTRVLCIR